MDVASLIISIIGCMSSILGVIMVSYLEFFKIKKISKGYQKEIQKSSIFKKNYEYFKTLSNNNKIEYTQILRNNELINLKNAPPFSINNDIEVKIDKRITVPIERGNKENINKLIKELHKYLNKDFLNFRNILNDLLYSLEDFLEKSNFENLKKVKGYFEKLNEKVNF